MIKANFGGMIRYLLKIWKSELLKEFLLKHVFGFYSHKFCTERAF